MLLLLLLLLLLCFCWLFFCRSLIQGGIELLDSYIYIYMHTGRECDELCVLYSVILLLMKEEEEGEKKRQLKNNACRTKTSKTQAEPLEEDHQ